MGCSSISATKILLTEFGDFDDLRLEFADHTQFVVTDRGKLIQMMNKSVSKVTGILKIIDFYGINSSGMMVFGDDFNDLEMFKMSAYSVTMLNAVDELKDLASGITDSNDNDGVAKVLEKMLRLRR